MTQEMLSGGAIVRHPAGCEAGHWAGAPGVFYEREDRAWYLTYRIRRPRGVAPDRGGEARIARSKDLQTWEDVWSVTKDQFNSASIERCALIRSPEGVWRYFVSYVDPVDGRWCVSVLEGSEIRLLDPERARPVFKASGLGLEGIKDPWIFQHGGDFFMLLSVAQRSPATNEQSHSTLDIFNTGDCVSATGLAVSRDLVEWDWQGVVFSPGSNGWDAYCRRINSILHWKDKYLGFYDGSATHLENYEEKTGLAVSSDLQHWESLSPDGPIFTSPNSSHSLRYIDARIEGEEVFLFYEFARPDGAHDLRLLKGTPSELRFPGQK
jgi:hypothetical protein